MAKYKILILNGKISKTHTFSGNITDTISGIILGETENNISGIISGFIYGINYVADNLKIYSGMASGIISGEITGKISGNISGMITNTISGIVTDKVSILIPGYSFLKHELHEELDWETESIDMLKEKLVSLYKQYPSNMFIPIHELKEELNLNYDECRRI